MVTNIFAPLQPGKYRAILADPPWKFKTYSPKGLGKSADGHYVTQSLDWIKSLPVASLAHPEGCALVLWATAPLLPQALDVMRAWGFDYKSAGAWAKQSATGQKWAFGTGYGWRNAAEFFLLGTRGRPKRAAKNIRNLIVAPVREHSRKPEQMRSDFLALFPGPHAELFARSPAQGYDVWGNQTSKFGDATC